MLTRHNRVLVCTWIMRSSLCLILSAVIWMGCTTRAASKGNSSSRRGEGGGGVPVTVTKVVQNDVPVDIQIVGNVEAYLTIAVKAQVAGQLTNVYFREGDYVQKGAALFTIDPRALDAQVSQAQANLAKDEAQLEQVQAVLARDEAQEKYAQAEASRYASLYQEGLISKEQTEEQVRANADVGSAAVRADKAAIQSARATVNATKAAVENTRVQLGYTSIQSPIDGRTGNLNVKQGNVVAANSTDLITINQVEPIYVTFSIPEAQRSGLKES